MHKTITAAVSALLLTPMLALAQFGTIDSFLGDIVAFINNVLIPLIFAVALFFFIYGMFKYFILGRDQADAKEEGKSYIVWSIVGFVLMVSIWGIVNLLVAGIGLDDENIDTIPDVPTGNP
jgi:hypothetical protein